MLTLLMKKLIWDVICRQSHGYVLTQQDGGGPGEGFHARHRRELPEAERPVVLAHLQRHSHHGQHVIQHLRHKTRGEEEQLQFYPNQCFLTDEMVKYIEREIKSSELFTDSCSFSSPPLISFVHWS